MNCHERKEIIQIFRKWVSEKPFIREVFIYGSRVQCVAHEESDLDIGIELEPAEGDENALTTYLCEFDNWKSELQPLIKWPLHLEFYDPAGETPTIAEGRRKHHILVYKRKRK